jgi:hypothetical protein
MNVSGSLGGGAWFMERHWVIFPRGKRLPIASAVYNLGLQEGVNRASPLDRHR